MTNTQDAQTLTTDANTHRREHTSFSLYSKYCKVYLHRTNLYDIKKKKKKKIIIF